jgi:predicted metal-dependent HD superfamily phosphohydrolase
MGANTGKQERERFVALWQRTLDHDPRRAEVAYAELVQRYREPHRHYHTLTHIRHCLRQFDQAVDLMDHPDAVEIALWFHDAVYEPGDPSNERRRAELFLALSAGAPPAFRRQVSRLILTTRHLSRPVNCQTALRK